MVKLSEKVRENPMYLFLLLLTVAVAVGFQGWRTLFNNFAVEEAGLNGLQVGTVQSVREIPGFLAIAIVLILPFIKEHKLAIVTVLLLAASVALTGFFPSFVGLIVTTLLMSIGFHYYETVNQSLTLQSFSKADTPMVLSRFKSVAALTNVAVGAIILALAYVLPYQWIYLIIGVAIVLIVLWIFIKLKVKQPGIPQHKKIIIRKRYWLFYTLNFLSGARRQIFVVFAVFMLVERYHFSVQEVTILFVINNLISWRLNPYMGRWINRYGERKMLSIEYISLFLIFAGYALIENRWLVGGLYIMDHIFFGFSIGINTYFKKTADPKDIAPSMATGFTINHIMAVVIPVMGGALWLWSWRLPFIVGSIIALMSLFFAQKIVLPKQSND